jgi:hypothetical protein
MPQFAGNCRFFASMWAMLPAAVSLPEIVQGNERGVLTGDFGVVQAEAQRRGSRTGLLTPRVVVLGGN